MAVPKNVEPVASDSKAEEKKEKDLKGKKNEKEEELSEEDLQLKQELEMLIGRLKDNNKSLHRGALEALRTHIRSSTTSMTSVPKPLKFLRGFYGTLTEIFEKLAAGDDKLLLSDIISVLSMTSVDEGKRNVLRYRLTGSKDALESWGHEYVRHLSMEIGQEYAVRAEKEEQTNDIVKLALEIVPFFLSHNAEADACDLLIEIEKLPEIVRFVDSNTWQRVSLYLQSCVSYFPFPEDIDILKVVYQVYKKVQKVSQAMTIAIKLNDMDLIKENFNSCQDYLLKKQLAFILARQQIRLETDDPELDKILSNSLLSENFLALAKELDILEAKVPEDIYKSHLENNKTQATSTVDSARHNLASTFVNGFVNAAFGKDKLIMTSEDTNSWIYKNKGHGMMSATASLGCLLLWDVEIGLTEIDKYLYSSDDYIKAGALLAIGLVNVHVKNESDPALALLSEYVSAASINQKIGAIMGLGMAYAGSARADLFELLIPILSDVGSNMQIVSTAALSLALIFVGSSNGDLTSSILQIMMERDENELKSPFARFLALSLSLLYLGKQEAVETTLETLKVIENPIGKISSVLCTACAYAGTGNVLKIQEMLHICSDHIDKEKEDDSHQAFAVLGIALIAIGEETGSQMALRMFNHLMHYGEPVIRRTVPLALGLICASNPLVNIMDTLGKYSHDNDTETAKNAIFAVGIVGAGTNNARLAQMLRHLASYYYKSPGELFLVRIAQGLIHMGKGTMSINPYHFDRSLLSPVAIAGLLTTLVAFTDSEHLILGDTPYLLYYLILSTFPRLLITLDENLKPLQTTVRVGQALDTVGQAGRPKTITGFQTHSTPVLMGHGERAELATEEYVSLSHILEGFVLLKKNPEFIVDVEMQ